MRNGWLLVLAAALGVSGTVMAAAPTPTQVEYSADETMETAEIAFAGPVYVAAGKERREQLIEGMRHITITRHDKKVMWTLMPEQQMYMEMKLDAAAAGSSGSDLSGYQVEQTTVGEEEVNGMMATKSKIIMTGKEGDKMGGFWWVTPEGIVIKLDVIGVDAGSKTRIKKELKNVSVGRQDPALFEIPAGYTRMSMMNMMMGGGGQEEGQDEAGAEDGTQTEAPPEKKKKSGFGMKDIMDMVK